MLLRAATSGRASQSEMSSEYCESGLKHPSLAWLEGRNQTGRQTRLSYHQTPLDAPGIVTFETAQNALRTF